jgi:hypothetical protein
VEYCPRRGSTELRWFNFIYYSPCPCSYHLRMSFGPEGLPAASLLRVCCLCRVRSLMWLLVLVASDSSSFADILCLLFHDCCEVLELPLYLIPNLFFHFDLPEAYLIWMVLI